MNPEINDPEMTPQERELASAAMQNMARVIDYTLNGKDTPKDQKHYGFALLVYPFGEIDRSHINYVGTGERGDVLTALKELVARWEGRMPQTTETRQ